VVVFRGCQLALGLQNVRQTHMRKRKHCRVARLFGQIKVPPRHLVGFWQLSGDDARNRQLQERPEKLATIAELLT
jgi:hypothetical protein